MLMEIFTKYIKTISTLVAITVGIVTIYFYFHKECHYCPKKFSQT